jgi:hypothetical protein
MRIFMSYASEDRACAERIALSLRGSDHTVFFDRDTLAKGQAYDGAIRKALHESDCMVFLLSPDSIAPGSYSLSELKYAREKWPHAKGRVLPVLAREVDWDIIPPYLSTVTALVPAGNVAAEVESEIAKWERQAGGAAASALITIPRRIWRAKYSPPGALLRPDYDRSVPFHGRQRELIDLDQWCNARAGIAVRLYTAAGGMGKTRLFIELCSRLTGVGWHTGFLSSNSRQAPVELWQTLSGRWQKTLVVIDYAETRREELISLLRAVDRRQQTIEQKQERFRIVLLARAADYWWDTMKAQEDCVGELLSGPATTKHRLAPLAMTYEERRESYSKALTAFADALGSAKPSDFPSDLSAEHFERVLLLHMSALATIDGVQVKGDQGILDYTLSRERRYWSQRLKAKQLSSTLELGILQGMAAITLGGGVKTKGEAVELLKKIPLLEDQKRIDLTALAALLHESYPGEKYIEPLQPDLLGEHLVQVALEDDPDALFALVLPSPGS